MELQNFLLCDDIRQEVGNKISLMGVFDDIIELNRHPQMPETDPITIKLSVCTKILFNEEDKNRQIGRMRVKMTNENGPEINIGEGELSLAGDNKIMKLNFISAFPATFNQDGNIAVEFDFLTAGGVLVDSVKSQHYKIVIRKRQ